MERLRIEGGRRLDGTVKIHGAKNSALPLLAATLLTKDECALHNCPRLSDVDVAMRILRHLGCRAVWEENTVSVQADAGLDMGDTLIGMHIRPVAVPYRGEITKVGNAHVTAAYSRLPYIGGERAVYQEK